MVQRPVRIPGRRSAGLAPACRGDAARCFGPRAAAGRAAGAGYRLPADPTGAPGLACLAATGRGAQLPGPARRRQRRAGDRAQAAARAGGAGLGQRAWHRDRALGQACAASAAAGGAQQRCGACDWPRHHRPHRLRRRGAGRADRPDLAGAAGLAAAARCRERAGHAGLRAGRRVTLPACAGRRRRLGNADRAAQDPAADSGVASDRRRPGAPAGTAGRCASGNRQRLAAARAALPEWRNLPRGAAKSGGACHCTTLRPRPVHQLRAQ